MSISVIPYLDESAVALMAEKAAKNALKANEANEANTDFATILDQSTSNMQAAFAKSYSTEEMERIFDDAAATYGVSSDLLKSIAKTESNFSSSALSSAGAVGVMQLMPATAASLGVSNSYDAKENIMGGAKLISQLLEKYNGNKSLALAAYNAGSGNVDKYGGIPPFTETQNYVSTVLDGIGENVSDYSASATLFDLSGDAREEANLMLDTFFSARNISKDSLDLLAALLNQTTEA